jgi:hypothetical protein
MDGVRKTRNFDLPGEVCYAIIFILHFLHLYSNAPKNYSRDFKVLFHIMFL